MENDNEEEADLRRMFRASGDCICETCGKEYWRHPFSKHRSWQDEPFLHVLCDGSLVKL